MIREVKIVKKKLSKVLIIIVVIMVVLVLMHLSMNYLVPFVKNMHSGMY